MRVYIGLWSYAESDNDRFGSLADPLPDITAMAASGAKPDVREGDFQNSNLNDCFHQERSFKTLDNHRYGSLLTAEAV